MSVTDEQQHAHSVGITWTGHGRSPRSVGTVPPRPPAVPGKCVKEPPRVFNNQDEVFKYISDEGVKYVDVRFCDLPGQMQHFTVPASEFSEDVFTNGLAFDGSSITGFQSINESDMTLLPDVATARIDPFRAQKTLHV